MLEISAFIITRNESTSLVKTVNSIKAIVKEIIVVDTGSTDDTVQIARSLNAKVFFTKEVSYIERRSFGESLCQNDWVLNVDVGEEFSKELQDEIEFIFASDNQDRYLAYRTKTVMLRRNNNLVYRFAPYNKAIRLYNRRYGSFANNSITNDSVVFNPGIDIQNKIRSLSKSAYSQEFIGDTEPRSASSTENFVTDSSLGSTHKLPAEVEFPERSNKIYDLNGIVYYRSAISIAHLVSKVNFYSSEQAQDLAKLGSNPSKIKIVSEIIFSFFKLFFIKRYWVFGFDGFIDSIVLAFAKFIKFAKVREALNNKKD